MLLSQMKLCDSSVLSNQCLSNLTCSQLRWDLGNGEAKLHISAEIGIIDNLHQSRIFIVNY